MAELYSKRVSYNRSLSLVLAAGLHVLVAALLLKLPAQGIIAAYVGPEPAVFAAREIADPTIDKSSTQIDVDSAEVNSPRATANVGFAKPGGVAEESYVRNAITPASATPPSDPFSGASLVFDAATPPMSDAEQSRVAAIGQLVTSVVSYSDLSACGAATASFVVTVQPDGSLADVQFISGSLHSDVGERLAHALDAKVVFPPMIGGTARRTIIGPIAVTPAAAMSVTPGVKEFNRCLS